MFASLVLVLAAAFAESKTLALQIHLDRAGYSCSTIDGVWGGKSERALRRYLEERAGCTNAVSLRNPEKAFDTYFAESPPPFRVEEVTKDDLAAVAAIPEAPAERAKLPRMGYESVKEMFAERGHLSQIALSKLNPGVDWSNVKPGL